MRVARSRLRRRALAGAVTLAALSGALAAPATAPGAYVPLGAFGEPGFGPGQFGEVESALKRPVDDPMGLALDRFGNLIAVDPANDRFQVFTKQGAVRAVIGRRDFDHGATTPAAIGAFFEPQDVVVDAQGFLYFTDNRNDRVTRWTPTGRMVARIGRSGSFTGRLVSPWGIGVHRAGVLFVADQGNYRISRFTTGGRPLSPIGGFGLGPGGLVHPYGLTLDAAGRVYVTDAIKGSVIVFTPTGRLLGEFGSLGSGPGELRKPTGIAVDRGNVILVSDYCNRRVAMFSPTGAPLGTFGEGALEGPTGIVADGQGAVWVSDFHRIVVFADVQPLREPRESVTQRAARRAGGAAADSRARASHRLGGNTLPEVCDGPVH